MIGKLSDPHRPWSVDFHPRDEQVGDVTVAVLDSRPGAPGQEPTFVLVHGLGMSSLYFRELAEHLARHARVVAVDLPGFGRTSRPERTLRMGSFALALERTIERLGLERVVLIGHSMGTQVVVETMARRPPEVTAGLLIGPVVNVDERRNRWVVQRFLQAATKETVASAWPSIRAYLQCGPRWFMDAFSAMVSYPIEDRIAEVTAPLAIMAGEYDRLAPRAWLELLAARAGGQASVHVIPGASHQVMVTHPETVTEVCLRLAEAGAR